MLNGAAVSQRHARPAAYPPAGSRNSTEQRMRSMAKWTRPTLDTKFHIDMNWWEQEQIDFRLYLHHQLCPEHRQRYPDYHRTELVDWIDPVTAEVKRVDALWQALLSCCSKRPDYLSDSTPLITAIFRVFLANNNTPMTPVELAQVIGRAQPEVILQLLTRGKIYRGIKPVPPE